MTFWDSSFTEAGATDMRRLLREDPEVVVWWVSPMECSSAVWRRYREGRMDLPGAHRLEDRIGSFMGAAVEVQPVDAVRERAGRLLSRHRLRAADSLQLSAALEWVQERPEGASFACLDQRLREAAALEGFSVLPADA